MVAAMGVVPTWLRWWLLISAFIVLWDAGFVLLRPWSMEGGPLFSIWMPYKLYGTIDLMYSEAKWKSGDRFCEAQSVCNLVEAGLQFFALYLLRRGQAPAGSLVVIITQAFTFWKTVLYWLYDILGGLDSTGHNPLTTWIFLYGIPNGLWIVVPFFAVVQVSGRMLQTLNQLVKQE